MNTWSDDTFDLLCLRSQALFKNKHVLPVAAWIAERQTETVAAPELVRGLGGRVPPNKVLEALERLRDSGILRELPSLGRPHKRIFEPLPTSFWALASEFASDATGTKAVD
jgi:hypothetical protein